MPLLLTGRRVGACALGRLVGFFDPIQARRLKR